MSIGSHTTSVVESGFGYSSSKRAPSFCRGVKGNSHSLVKVHRSVGKYGACSDVHPKPQRRSILPNRVV